MLGNEQYTGMFVMCRKRVADEKLQAVQNIYNQACAETEQMKIDSKKRADMIRLAQDISKEHTLTQTLSEMLIDKVFVYPDKRIEISWKVRDFCRDYAENV